MKIITALTSILAFIVVFTLVNPVLSAYTPWVVHVASFKSKIDANGLKDTLSKNDYNAYLTEFIKDGIKWYRVRVGFYPTEGEAKKQGVAISKKFSTSEPWIVRAGKEETPKSAEKTPPQSIRPVTTYARYTYARDTYASKKDYVGEIISIRGKAEIVRKGGAVAARSGDVLIAGDTVKTFEDSKIRIIFNDYSSVYVSENSTMVVKDFSLNQKTERRNVILNALAGKFRFDILKIMKITMKNNLRPWRDTSFTVNTPSSVAGVKGTNFILDVDREITTITVFDGIVSIKNSDPLIKEEVLIKANYSTTVIKDEPPSEPVLATPEQMQALQRETAPIDENDLPPANMLTVAGGARNGYSGDNGPATLAKLNYPEGIFIDSKGNVFIADTDNHSIRKVDPNGIITTVAGTGKPGYSGDGGTATSSQLNYPYGVFVDSRGNVYIADTHNHSIRKVDPNGIITTVVGTGESGYSGDGGTAIAAKINQPYSVTVDSKDIIYIADTHNHSIRKVDPNGIITTVAGTGKPGYSGDGSQSNIAQINYPEGITVDSKGNIYIADSHNHRVRMVDLNGIIQTVAGSGKPGYSGDGAQSRLAKLNYPSSVSMDAKGNIYVSDTDNHSIRKVDTRGVITTVASNRVSAYSFYDRSKAYSRSFNYSYNISVDSNGNIYMADTYNHRICKIITSIDIAVIESVHPNNRDLQQKRFNL